MFQTISECFWWDRIWLPPNLTWSDLEDGHGRVYAKASHLYVTVPYAMAFLIIRYLFERLIATPLAACFGIRESVRHRAADSVILERHYLSFSKTPAQLEIDGLTKKCGWSRRQVERWFRQRRNQDRPGILKKFKEASWRFIFYLLACIGGLIALYDKPWFYDTREVWVGFPKQSMLASQYWYYIIEMSFYWSLLFSVASDVKRKDFKEQIIHHLATLTLLAFSWCANYIRIGTMVMLVHDISDVLLESGKLFNYAKWERTCDVIFVVFALVFMVTRLIIYPFWLIHCAWVYPLLDFPPFFGYYFFNLMMMVLQLLHLFWAYLILRMVKKFIFGNMKGDDRSDHEEEEDEMSVEEEEVHLKVRNGSGAGGVHRDD
ncbi:ceramide synthase 2-like [Conger conger]|uniref:ceramide synthase 2-like n=1 Tax=Conger conger TaxID=82655 RepID=UPI002A5A96BD|nr:ceramide synthase 2-like [Conger conger]